MCANMSNFSLAVLSSAVFLIKYHHMKAFTNKENISAALRCIAYTVGALALSSCMMGPDYVRPEMTAPKAFRSAPSTEQSVANLPWWDVMSDSGMKNLLESTYTNNRSIAVMNANVDSASQYIRVTSAPLFPWLGYSANASRGANQSGGQAIAQQGGAISSPGAGYASATWELDIWGRTGRQVEAVESAYFSATEQMRALRLSLLTQVSAGYLELLMLDEQLRISHEAVKSYSDSLKLFTDQLEGGTGNRLQVESGRAALAAAQATIPILEAQVVEMENMLNALAGRMPGTISRKGLLADYAKASKIPSGMPSALLAQRPDILQAEHEVRAANAKVGVAIANYFPSIALTGAYGAATHDFSSSVSKRAGWGMGASLTGPLFRAGSLSAEKKIAKNDLKAAIASYEQSVFSAMAEVSTTLTQREKLRIVMLRQEEAVKAYRISVQTAMDLYKFGESNYYEVLTAQQNLFPAEKQLAAYRYQYAATIPTLYAQLGGGFKKAKN